MPYKRLNFKNKLFVLFLLFSILPLSSVALIVYHNVEIQIQRLLEISFEEISGIHQRSIVNFLTNTKSFVNSLTVQDLLLEEVEKQILDQPFDEGKIFSTLVSIKRSNPFIEKIYIVDKYDTIFMSTATDEIDSFVGKVGIYADSLIARESLVGAVINSSYNKRVVPFSSLFIRKSDNVVVGVLVLELNISAVKSSYSEISPPDSSLQEGQPQKANTYIVDQNNISLTKLESINPHDRIDTQPTKACFKNNRDSSGVWKNYLGKEVLGVSKCITLDNLRWTLITEQSTKEAFSAGDQLGFIILFITLLVTILLLFVIIKVSKSITSPIKILNEGAKQLGRGNLNYRLKLDTGDELQNLAASFNQMAQKLKNYISDLRQKDTDLIDINKKLEKEKTALTAERNKLKFVISGITDAVIAVDLNHKVISHNRAFENLTELKPKEVTNKPLEELIKIFDQNKELQITDYCLTKKDTKGRVVFRKNGLKMIILKEGRELFVNLVVGRPKEGEHVRLGHILTIHDISSEHELERMKLDIVSIAAHQLRTPLSRAKWAIRMIIDKEFGQINKKQKALFKQLFDSNEQMIRLVADLLNIGRIKERRFEYDFQLHDIVSVIEHIVKNYKSLLKSKKIKLKINKNIESQLFLLDFKKIELGLGNIIDNAINYTQDKGHIAISIEKVKKNVVIEVKDTGIGIPEDEQKHLFSKFFRSKNALLKQTSGTGLGLFIAQKIINAHGGEIKIISKENEGTTTIVTLPLRKKKRA